MGQAHWERKKAAKKGRVEEGQPQLRATGQWEKSCVDREGATWKTLIGTWWSGWRSISWGHTAYIPAQVA